MDIHTSFFLIIYSAIQNRFSYKLYFFNTKEGRTDGIFFQNNTYIIINTTDYLYIRITIGRTYNKHSIDPN